MDAAADAAVPGIATGVCGWCLSGVLGAERHKLERIKVIGDDARMTDAAPRSSLPLRCAEDRRLLVDRKVRHGSDSCCCACTADHIWVFVCSEPDECPIASLLVGLTWIAGRPILGGSPLDHRRFLGVQAPDCR